MAIPHTLQAISLFSNGGAGLNKLVAQFNSLDAAAIKNIASSKGMSKGLFEQVIARTTLDDAVKQSIVNEYAEIAAKNTHTIATFSLSSALKGLWGTMTAFAVSNPILTAIIGVSAAFWAIKKVIDAVNVSAEKQQEIFSNLKSEYDQQLSEVKELESELKTVESRIKELTKLLETGSLTPNQEEELRQLELTNQELKYRLDLEKQLADIKKDEVSASAVDTYNTVTYTTGSTETDPTGTIDVEKQFLGVDAINDIMSQLDKYKEKRDALLASPPEDKSLLQKYKKQIEDIDASIKALHASAAKIAREISNEAAQMNKTGPDAEYRELIVDAVKAWLDYGDSGADAINTVSDALDGQKGKINETTISTKELADQIKAIGESSKLLKSATDELRERGGLSASTLQSILDKFGEGASTDLTSNVQEYILGLRTAQELLNDLSNAYQTDEDNFKKTIIAKSDMMDELYGNLTDNQKNLIAEYAAAYDVDLTNFKSLESTKLQFQAEVVRQLAANYAHYNNATLDMLKHSKAMLEDVSLGFLPSAPGTDMQKIRNELAAVNETIAKIEDMNAKIDGVVLDSIPYTPGKYEKQSGGSKKTQKTPEELAYEKNKKLFEEEYKAWKHKLDMEQITLEEFYAWLDGQNGYKKYFKAQGLALDDYRKYEKEVFDGMRKVREGYLQDIDHEIDMLGRQEGNEQAIINKYIEKEAELKKLIKLTHDYLKALGMTEDEIARNDVMQGYQTSLQDTLDSIDSVFKSVYDKMADNVNGLIDLTKEMIKQEAEDMIDALERESDEYSKLIAKRKELLQLGQREKEYNEQVAEKSKEISKIQARINALSLDDSREAAIERGALEEQLAELQKDLSKTQNDHYITVTEEALDKEEQNFKDLQDKKIQEIREFLKDNEALNNAALNRLDKMNQSLFDKLMAYAKKYTTTTRSELEAMWDAASKAAEKYGSITNASQIYEKGDVKNEAQAIVAKMRENGRKYAAATSDAERKKYADDSLKRGEELSKLLGEDVYRDGNGVWWIGNRKLFEVYHAGTASAGLFPTPRQDEMMAMVQKGEMILNQKQQDGLYKIMQSFNPVNAFKSMISAPNWAPGMQLAGAGGPNINVEAPIYMTGNLTEETLRVLKEHARTVANVVAAQLTRK